MPNPRGRQLRPLPSVFRRSQALGCIRQTHEVVAGLEAASDRRAGTVDNPALRFELRCVIVSIIDPSSQR
jgi:hypothetical protein